MNRTSGRVSIPQNVGEMLALAASVYQKHQNEGEGSPLNNVDGLDWSAVGPTISQALDTQRSRGVKSTDGNGLSRTRPLYPSDFQRA